MPFTKEEVFKVLSGLNGDKTLGLGGFPMLSSNLVETL